MPLVEPAGATSSTAVWPTASPTTSSQARQIARAVVIARGLGLRSGGADIGPEDAGRQLDVIMSRAALRRMTARIDVTIELVEAQTAHIVWTEASTAARRRLVILDEIGNRIVAAIASEIEMAERNRAVLKPPNSLNAWEAYHRGLWHMYRFTRRRTTGPAFLRDGGGARPHFLPGLCRPLLHPFPERFSHWAGPRAGDDRAFRAAGQGLIVDGVIPPPTGPWAGRCGCAAREDSRSSSSSRRWSSARTSRSATTRWLLSTASRAIRAPPSAPPIIRAA